MKRCVVGVVTSVDVGMSIKKALDALAVAIARCQVKRCAAADTGSIDVGISIKKELDALMMAAIGCVMKRCEVVVLIDGVDIGMSSKKELDASMMATIRCKVKWSGVVHTSSVDLSVSIKKELDASMATIERCIMEWRVVGVVNSVDVGMSIKKELDALMMVSERCQMERGGAAVISSIDVGVSIKEEPHLDQPALSSSINESLIEISLRSHGRDDPHQPTGSRRAVSPSKSTSPRETQQQQRARHESNGSIDRWRSHCSRPPSPFHPSIAIDLLFDSQSTTSIRLVSMRTREMDVLLIGCC